MVEQDKIPAWYQLNAADVLKRVKSRQEGLSQAEVTARQKEYGPNALPEKARLSDLQIFIGQFKSAFIYMLLIAVAISALLGETVDAAVIMAAVIINVIVGYLQEHKAQAALAALEKIVTTQARVRRAGRVSIIEAAELVPGDIIELQAGDKVPADLRLLVVNDLSLTEASLTGESEPVTKTAKKLKGDLVIGDRKNLGFMGTSVSRGTGLGVVVAAGLQTAIGQIASLVKTTEEEQTPLQRKLDRFSKKLAWLIVILSVVIFVIGLALGTDVAEMFTTVVAIAVAAIPEGLVVALTVILAIGMREILRHHGLVKKLLAAETLGSTSVICSDKTGTLTQGEMRVATVVGEQETRLEDEVVKVVDPPSPRLRRAGPQVPAEYAQAMRIGVLCNNAIFANPPLTKGGSSDGNVGTGGSEAFLTSPQPPPSKGEGEVIGTPTEKALLLAGWQAGLSREAVEKSYPRLCELPFSSEYKYMMTLHSFSDRENIVYLKGAPEIVLNKFASYKYDYAQNVRAKELHKHLPLTTQDKQRLKRRYEQMSAKGLRVLAVAYKKTNPNIKVIKKGDPLTDFVFVGFIGLKDPLRPDTRDTIAKTQAAGITSVMITGDHKLTARSIAHDLGLPSEAANVIEGAELAQMSESELKKRVPKTSVFARVSPEDKLKIVKAWQSRGAVVAMTGDGVNDAPAIKRADIGVAVGSGTDVAKEVADLVLLDDDFKTIVTAVEKGRVIYDNVRKVILYFLANAFAEMGVIMGGLFLGWPLPILASQILWVNLVNDILPSLALAQDPEEHEVMNEPPQPKSASILDKERLVIVAVTSILTWAGLLGLFWYYWQGDPANLVHARSVAFVALGAVTLLYIFSLRSLRRPIWRINLLDNKFLIVSVLIGFALQAFAVYLPFMQKILRSGPLSLMDWVVVIAVSLVLVAAIEIVKLVFIHTRKRR